MARDADSKGVDRHLILTVPESFPDDATCGVKKAELDGYFICLNHWGCFCPFALMLDHGRFCDHSTNHEIFLHSVQATQIRAG